MQRPTRRILVACALAGAVPLVTPRTVSANSVRPVQDRPHVRATAPFRVVGTISIPKLKVRQPILAGITDSVFDRGVGHWPGTALPGQVGNMVIGGHRTSGQHPFYDIQKLAVGDLILVNRRGHSYTYAVNGTRIVKANAVWILKQTRNETLTLFTCHPRGSIRQRYVVTATLQT